MPVTQYDVRNSKRSLLAHPVFLVIAVFSDGGTDCCNFFFVRVRCRSSALKKHNRSCHNGHTRDQHCQKCEHGPHPGQHQRHTLIKNLVFHADLVYANAIERGYPVHLSLVPLGHADEFPVGSCWPVRHGTIANRVTEMRIAVFAGALLSTLVAAASADDNSIDEAQLEADAVVVGEIVLDKNDIFDLTDERENNALFRLANKLHIITKNQVIEKQLLLPKNPPDRVFRQ